MNLTINQKQSGVSINSKGGKVKNNVSVVSVMKIKLLYLPDETAYIFDIYLYNAAKNYLDIDNNRLFLIIYQKTKLSNSFRC